MEAKGALGEGQGGGKVLQLREVQGEA